MRRGKKSVMPELLKDELLPKGVNALQILMENGIKGCIFRESMLKSWCLTIGGARKHAESIICIALTVIVLLQEGKSQGLGSISGMADSYWGKNKGRSMEGTLEKFTKFAAVAVLLLALILNIIW